MFEMDDSPMNVSGLEWGGCFCEYCVTKFTEYLKIKATAEDIERWGVDNIEAFDIKNYLLAIG